MLVKRPPSKGVILKKIIGFSIGLVVVLFIAHKVATSFSTDYRDEIRIGAEPLLNDHATGLWILIKARGQLSKDDFAGMRDPWGNQIRAEYQNHILTLTSSGADMKFETKDDIIVERKVE
jgi:hypothetical protein